MLINGSSIYYDHSFTAYDYYHIELEEHSVITANGVLSESYLDTSNYLHQKEKVIQLKPAKSWEKDAAAPLVTERAIVESLYHQYKARAALLGIENKEPAIVTTMDPDFHLVTDKGQVVYPHSKNKQGHYIFALPQHVKYVNLKSLSSRPCDAIGVFVDDRRDLGILVGEVTVFEESGRVRQITKHLEQKTLTGWHQWENVRCRWTKGDAVLSLDISSEQTNTRLLVIEVVAAGPYLVNKPVMQDRISA